MHDLAIPVICFVVTCPVILHGVGSFWSLYPWLGLCRYGKGVPKGNAALKVNASSWWVPEPGGDVPATKSSTHEKKFTVMSAPGQPVLSPCVDAATGKATCPFPMQLFLQDKVTVTASYNKDFDLRTYPYDKYLLRAELQLADNFATTDESYTIVAKQIVPGEVLAPPKGLYSGSDFAVDGFSYAVDGTNVVIELRLYRQQPGPYVLLGCLRGLSAKKMLWLQG